MAVAPHPLGWRPWHSLRWRLPLMISLMMMAILAIVLLGAYREMQSALTTASAQRARAAAGQVSALIEPLLRSATAQIRSAATEPPLRDFLKARSPDAREQAEATMRRLITGGGPRTISLWDATGHRVLEVKAPDTSDADVPPGDPPKAEGLDLQPAGERGLLQSAAIVSDLYPTHANLGYLVVRSVFNINPPGLFSRLVGDNAIVLLGTRGTNRWANLTTRDLVDRQAQRPARSHIGAEVDIRDTNLQIAVDFPEAAALEPARRFLQRMITLSILIALASAVVVRELTARFAQPLVDLTSATEAVALGNFSRRIRSERRDELGRLGRAFDAMSVRLSEDLAERERAARVLSQHKERLHYTLTAAQVGTFEVDLETGVMDWSDTMGPLFGRTPEELPPLATDAIALLHPDDRERATASLARDAADQREHELFVRAQQPDGSHRWLVARSRQLIDDSGHRRLAGVCFDITEQRTLEEQLRQSQKMDAIGKLAGGIAHDFNNLLTAILGFGNMLLESLDRNDPRSTDVQQILNAGNRAAGLTAQLLAFSRQQLLQPVIVDVNQAVEDTAVLLRRLIGENIRLETRLAPARATVRADPVQLQQVIMNLAINARDAMPEGGALSIEIAHVDLDASLGGPHLPVVAGPYVRLEVRDTGVGMTEAVRSRLFEPFFTTKKRGEGTGLGLSTVYGAVKQAGGYIQVDGEPGQGSCFKVYLPGVLEETPAPVSAGKTESAAAGSETILLVEDEAAVRLLSRMMLERAGYRVIEAPSAEAAETTHLAYAGSIRLLITDVVLPGSSGADLFQRLSVRDPRLKVLYMSGYTDDAVFRTGRLQRGVAFLQKPFTADALRRKTREVLDE